MKQRTIAMLSFALALGLAGSAAAQSMALPEPVGMGQDPAARLVLEGNAAFMHGDLAQADAEYRQALHRKPDFAIASFNLGLVEIHAGQRQAGLAVMDRGIALARRHGMGAAYLERLQHLRAAFAAPPQST